MIDVQRALLELVAHRGPMARQHPISRPAVSRHLRLLGEAGLATADDHGRERHYRLPTPLVEIRAFLDQLSPGPATRIPESALDALDTEVRRTSRDRWRCRGGRLRGRLLPRVA